jgi:hypothetical protein
MTVAGVILSLWLVVEVMAVLAARPAQPAVTKLIYQR